MAVFGLPELGTNLSLFFAAGRVHRRRWCLPRIALGLGLLDERADVTVVAGLDDDDGGAGRSCRTESLAAHMRARPADERGDASWLMEP